MLAKKTIEKKKPLRSNRFGRSGLLSSAQKTALDQRSITKQVLGIGQYRSSLTKIISLSWRFVAAFLFVFYLSTGFSPFDLYSAFGNFGVKEIAYVDFYSRASLSEVQSEDYSLGWWNSEKVVGEPDVNSLGGLFLFSDENSAFYSGGRFSLVCDDFTTLDESLGNLNNNKNEEEASSAIEVEDEFINNSFEENENSEIPLSEVYNIGEEENASSTVIEDILEIGTSTEDEQEGIDAGPKEAEKIDKTEEVEEESGLIPEQVIFEQDANSNDAAAEEEKMELETIELEEDTTPVEVYTEEPKEEEVKIEEISFLDKLKSFLNRKEVLADNETSEYEKFYGKFRSAKIKLSLAVGSISSRFNATSVNTKKEINSENIEADENIVDDSTDNTDNSYFVDDLENEISSEEEPAEIEEEIIDTEVIDDSYDDIEVIEVEDSVQAEIINEDENIISEQTEDALPEEQNDLLGLIKDTLKNKAANAQNLALAQEGEEKLAIWFALDNSANSEEASSSELIWEKLDTIYANDFSNALNGEYLSYEAPFLKNWEDVKNLKIKIEGLYENKIDFVVYLDSIWTEVVYEKSDTSKETEEEKKARLENALEFLSTQVDFRINEKGQLKFKYVKNKERLLEQIGGFFGFSDYWSNVNLKAELFDNDGNFLDIPLTMILEEDGSFTIMLPETERVLEPGLYKIKFTILDNSGETEEILTLTKDFSWGVLAVNTNKSIYTPGENAYLQMGVLDDDGHTICDAELEITITSPDGIVTSLSTFTGEIIKNPDCGPNNVITTPDYYTYFNTRDSGIYQVSLKAHTENGTKEITDNFEVRDEVPFEIERIGSTRIYPWADYDMKLIIKANEEFTGDIIEIVPDGFNIVGDEVKITYSEASSTIDKTFIIQKDEIDKKLIWQDVHLAVGDVLEIRYVFDAPNVSPEFYLLGPISLGEADEIIFKESRKWQIASDANVDALHAAAIGVTAGTTASTWTTVVSIPGASFTGGNKYMIYVSSGFAANNTNAITNYRIVYNTTAQFTGAVETTSGTANDATQVSWFDVYDQPSTPVDVLLQYSTSANTSYALNAQIMVIDLSDLQTTDYKYGTNLTSLQHTTGFVDKASITLDQANGAKDWFVMAMEEVIVDSATVNYEGQIFDGTAASMTHSREGEDANEIVSYVIYRPYDDVATNTVFTMQVRDDATGVNDHLKSKIFALNLDAFESHKTYYNTPASTLAASPSWTSVGNLDTGGNYTPLTTGDQIIFSSLITVHSGTDDGQNTRLQVGGVTTPVSWSWAQSPVLNFTNYDATDDIAQNIATKISIPDTGQSIDLSGQLLAGTSVTADEVSMTVFSVKKANQYRPTGVINSVVQRRDGTGVVDLSIDVNDFDYNPSVAKLEYATGTSCVFSPSGDPTIDTNDDNTTADNGDPDIDNDYPYQIGTSTNYILTTSGSNTVNFDWFSKTDLPQADGTYCLQLTASDGQYDQLIPATTTLTIDNTKPTNPGELSLNSRTGTSITLNFGATSTETNFREYKIFYQIYDGTDPTEADSVQASSTNANLGNILFNSKATTTIGGLSAGIKYSFAIWTYDNYGYKASSSRVDIVANDAPTGSFNIGSIGQKTNGSGIVDVSIEISDTNNNNSRAMLEYSSGADCAFSPSLDPSLDAGSVSSDFGSVVIDNDHPYQIGSSTGWVTTPSSNTVTFDWLTSSQIPDADGTYCLRLTANDTYDDQFIPATTTVVLDNIEPAPTGNLTIGTIATTSIVIIYPTATPATDTNEPTSNAYKIFYKQAQSGVSEGDIEHDNIYLDSYDYNGATSSKITGLTQNTWYVFNIWAYDTFGNKISSTEVAAKTLATVGNISLTFTNAQSEGVNTNIALGGLEEWNFRAVINETNGWYQIASTTLRLANNTDNLAPYDDLVFYWDQTANEFYEIGADVSNVATISENSVANCSDISCTLDFKIIFNKNFDSTSFNYSANLFTANDIGVTDEDDYENFYQVRKIYTDQIHYRWRNDDGGE